jgi:spermidine-citrate ligase
VTTSTLRLAELASFETFVNCYVHELSAGTFHPRESWALNVDPAWPGRGCHVLELLLPQQRVRLALDVNYRSAAGCHEFAAVRVKQRSGDWEDADELHSLFLLVRELYATPGPTCARPGELRTLARLLESVQVMALYLTEREHSRVPIVERFIEAEQSILFGHWRHPMPKSRSGMAEWQHKSTSPELEGRFQLHGFAIVRDLIRSGSALEQSAEDVVAACLGVDARARAILTSARARDEVVVPVHPLQLGWLRGQAHVEDWASRGLLRDVGPLGPRFTATSSVRTVYSEDCEYMLKFSIPVQITNSVRFNKQGELLAGVTMASLLQKLGPCGITVIPDPAYLSVAAPGGGESGFELIVRANPFPRGRDAGVACVAALTQRALPHRAPRLRALIEGLALTESRNVATVALDWLVRYMRCAIEPLIRLYDDQGIALEAHQQNCLLDVSGGYPRRAYFRDNQGYYLSTAHRERLVSLEPALAHQPDLFFDDAVIAKHFCYYVVQNQLFSVVHRLGAEGLLDECVALHAVKARLSTLLGRLNAGGRALLQSLLTDRTLACKANLLTRARDIDELSCELDAVVYVPVDNPFLSAVESARERTREVA